MGERGLRLLVCGGRDYADREAMHKTLSRIRDGKGISVLIHGDAKGADSLAGEWARDFGIDLTVFPANWTKHGKAAGPIRNARMLAEGRPDACVAFPPGPKLEESGTADMVRKCEASGVPVWKVNW